MKKEMFRKRSAASTVMAVFIILMMTAVMTLAGTLAVFADDNNIPPLPGHGQSGYHDAGWGNSEYNEQLSLGGDGISGSSGENGHELKKDWTADPDPDLSDFGSTGGNMYEIKDPVPGSNDPANDPNSRNDDNSNNGHEIGNTSADDIDNEPFEEKQLSATPPAEEGDKGPSDPEKDKTDTPEKAEPANIGKEQPESDGRPDKETKKDPEINDNAVIRVSNNTPDTSDGGKDKGGTDKTKASGSPNSSDATTGIAETGSPQTGDSSGLADAVTLLILSMACLAAMIHSRRNKESDMKGH